MGVENQGSVVVVSGCICLVCRIAWADIVTFCHGTSYSQLGCGDPVCIISSHYIPINNTLLPMEENPGHLVVGVVRRRPEKTRQSSVARRQRSQASSALVRFERDSCFAKRDESRAAGPPALAKR